MSGNNKNCRCYIILRGFLSSSRTVFILYLVQNFGNFVFTKSQILSKLGLEMSKLRHSKGKCCLLYYDTPSAFFNQKQGAYVIMIFGTPTLLIYPQYTSLSAYNEEQNKPTICPLMKQTM